jgi:hypothetical protein
MSKNESIAVVLYVTQSAIVLVAFQQPNAFFQQLFDFMQSRFEVNIPELSNEIDISSYMTT